MSTTIFYFSATGNSLSFARKLASRLEDCQLRSISSELENDNIKTTSESIGFVFPVYAWGMPRIVEEFIRKLQIAGHPYLFSVVSCYGIAAKTLDSADKLLQNKGFGLQAGFVIKSGRGSLMKMNSFDKIIIALDRQRKHLRTGDERLDEISNVIKNKETHSNEKSSVPANLFGSMFHSYGIDFFKTAARDFSISQDCTGCGKCVRLCPRANIRITDTKPAFGNDCELCHACIQWCLEFAISHPGFDTSLQQYHNPHVQFKDLGVNF